MHLCFVCVYVRTAQVLGVHDVLGFEFLDPPSEETIANGLRQLYLLGALDEDGVCARARLLVCRYATVFALDRLCVCVYVCICVPHYVLVCARTCTHVHVLDSFRAARPLHLYPPRFLSQDL